MPCAFPEFWKKFTYLDSLVAPLGFDESQLALFTNLTTLRLASPLQRFVRSLPPALTTLDSPNSHINLAHFPQIRSLNVRKIFLNTLGDLTNLTSLTFSEYERDKKVGRISAGLPIRDWIPQLTSLTCLGLPQTLQVHLTPLTSLRHLDAPVVPPSFTFLRSLKLNHRTRIPDLSLFSLLTRLDLSWAFDASSPVLSGLSTLSYLTKLCRICSGVPPLSSLRSLSCTIISGEVLRSLTSLTSLKLSQHCTLPPTLTNLTTLHMPGTKFKKIRNFTNLVKLGILSEQISANKLSTFPFLQKVEHMKFFTPLYESLDVWEVPPKNSSSSSYDSNSFDEY
jgi:hypothetical protein